MSHQRESVAIKLEGFSYSCVQSEKAFTSGWKTHLHSTHSGSSRAVHEQCT